MKFSIIVPVYNAESFLKGSLNSALNQVRGEWGFEVVVVDDGSKNSSGRICRDLEAAHKGELVYFRQNNAGTFLARKKGIELASGDYLLFLDGDDELRADALKVLACKLNNNRPSVAVFGASRNRGFSPDRLTSTVALTHGGGEGDALFFYREALLCGDSQNSLWTKVVARDVALKALGKIDIGRMTVSEDRLLNIAIANEASSVLAIDECLYFYRPNLEGVSFSEYRRAHLRDYLACHELAEGFVRSWSNVDKARKLSTQTLAHVCSEFLLPSFLELSKERKAEEFAWVNSQAAFREAVANVDRENLRLWHRVALSTIENRSPALLSAMSKSIQAIKCMRGNL